MPVSWRIAERYLLLESDEDATFEEWAAAVDAGLRDPGFRPGMGLVHDARRMGRVPSPDEANRRVEFLQRRMERMKISRWAVVVASSRPAQYGMAHMAEAFADVAGAPFRVFKDDFPDAIAWTNGADVKGGSAG
jgi:hypothetical protein